MGCAVNRVACSICGQELGRCAHAKGRRYDGQLCHGVLTGVADAYEWSFVAVPAQRKAGVVSKRFGGPRDSEKALQRARARLELEKARYGNVL